MKLNKIILVIVAMLITLGMAGKASANGINLSSNAVQITNNTQQTKHITLTHVTSVCGIKTLQTKETSLQPGMMLVEPISQGQPAQLIASGAGYLYVSNLLY
ncbi:hypothetical protein N6G95_09480 [Pediococcus inopinatus]|uniref:hypothetical protein n=1 Tax=Pediococcus inopinatus TaxID=114090 RepID=UPI002B2576A4|nr:hypothetical protein [Pediococcus inopinatus]WPC19434.1 hypothetical protein N6G95_09480 [Pediococcus inopinatus]